MHRPNSNIILAIGLVLAFAATARQSTAAEKWEYGELESDTRLPGQALIRWVTATGATEGSGWLNLADKLNAPKINTENMSSQQRVFSETIHRLRALTQLGSEGWELVTQNRTDNSPVRTWTFKRKLE